MVAVIDLRITREPLISLLEAFHPMRIPFGEESLIQRTIRAIEQTDPEKIVMIVAQNPEEIERECGEKTEKGIAIEYWLVSLNDDVDSRLGNLYDHYLRIAPLTILNRYELERFLRISEQYAGSCRSRDGLVSVIKQGTTMQRLDIAFDQLFSPVELFDLYRKHETRFLYKRAEMNGHVFIGRGSRIGANTILDHAIIMQDTVIGKNLTFKNKLVCGSWIIDLDDLSMVEADNPLICHTRKPVVVPALIRGTEIILSGIGLLILLPLFAFVSLLIKLDSKGPVFYRSMRVTAPMRLHGFSFSPERQVPFTVFRTMYTDADQRINSAELTNKYESGPYKKFDNDCRITRIGGFLRKTSLDELPLLWHVFKGDISLVGTWALPRYEAEAMDVQGVKGDNLDLSDVARSRFHSHPGIAGLWQAGGRSALTAEERSLLDALQTAIEYRGNTLNSMKNPRYSIMGYMKSIFNTVYSVLICRGAQ